MEAINVVTIVVVGLVSFFVLMLLYTLLAAAFKGLCSPGFREKFLSFAGLVGLGYGGYYIARFFLG